MPGLTPLPLGCPQDHTVNYVPETRFPPLATQRMWDRVQEVWCTILSMSVPAGGSPQVLWGKVNRVGGQSAPTCSLGSAPPLVSNDLPSANCEWGGAAHTSPSSAGLIQPRTFSCISGAVCQHRLFPVWPPRGPGPQQPEAAAALRHGVLSILGQRRVGDRRLRD